MKGKAGRGGNETVDVDHTRETLQLDQHALELASWVAVDVVGHDPNGPDEKTEPDAETGPDEQLGGAIVLLHDGLGSIEQWRTVPELLALRTQRRVYAYNRAGHGRSSPEPDGPWPWDWLHSEAGVLGQVLEAKALRSPHLVGHSDGGSIAALHAAGSDDDYAPASLCLLAAHSWVEEVTRTEIARLTARRQQVVAGLQHFHRNPAALFEAWSSVWLSERFSRWDIRSRLHTIDCPTLAVQGSEDEYATPAHLTATTTAIGPNARPLLLEGQRHLLHHHDPDIVVKLVAEFLG